jgi:hypothetical protein
MAQLKLSSLSSYNLSPEEQLAGHKLTPENTYVIQNHICELSEEKLALKYDPSQPMWFVQREAELQGQIGILKMLLGLSESAHLNLSPDQE